MNVRQIGLGTCPTHGIAILSDSTGKGICFACEQEALPKTGHTVVVKESSQDAGGKVTLINPDKIGLDAQTTIELERKENAIILSFSLEDLESTNIKNIIIVKCIEEIDNLPVKTHGESKRLSAIQEHLLSLVEEQPRQKRKYTKHDKSTKEGADKGTSEISGTD